jgi:tRNA dimethylallyltransferase
VSFLPAPLVIVGPTGAGKTAAALRVAERHGVPVVSMDAMQVYRGMDIGTAKVTAAERARVPHHCIDVRDPCEPFSAQDFAEVVDGIGVRSVLCGGTVFYLRAWMQPLVETPPVDPALRATLEALTDPHARLREVDPVLAARLHPNDRVRVVRGLEVHALTGRPLSQLHAEDPGTRRPCTVAWVDRDDLDAVIDARVDAMMEAGYLDEVERLLAAGVPRDCKPMQSLGYRHLADHLCGEIDLPEAVLRTKRDTRRFARKQRGFLRGLGLTPVPHDEVDRLAERVFGGDAR